jgi:hypothetical protein
MNNSIYLFATLALVFLFEAQNVVTAAQAPAPSKPAGARDQPAAGTPEAVLIEFLNAMGEGNRAGIERTAVPHPELWRLWQSPPLTPVQKAMMKAAIVPSAFRRLKVGEVVQLGNGKELKIDANRINDHTLMIASKDMPLPFILVKGDAGWKVDASPMIAGRKAAEAVRERHRAGNGPTWTADEKLLVRLSKDTTIDGFAFRPPAGYRPLTVSLHTGHASGWIAARNKQSSAASIIVTVIPMKSESSRTLSSILELSLSPFKQRYGLEWSRTPDELGRIDNMTCARAKWSGTCTVGPKELVGKHLKGMIYVMESDNKFVQVLIKGVLPEDEDALPLCEASALTLRRVTP